MPKKILHWDEFTDGTALQQNRRNRNWLTATLFFVSSVTILVLTKDADQKASFEADCDGPWCRRRLSAAAAKKVADVVSVEQPENVSFPLSRQRDGPSGAHVDQNLCQMLRGRRPGGRIGSPERCESDEIP